MHSHVSASEGGARLYLLQVWLTFGIHFKILVLYRFVGAGTPPCSVSYQEYDFAGSANMIETIEFLSCRSKGILEAC